MKHTHFYFGKAIPCPKPETCFLAKLQEPVKAKTEWRKPEGIVPTPEEIKVAQKQASEAKARTRVRHHKRPLPRKPARVASYRRIGPYGTEAQTALDVKYDDRF